MMRSMPSGYELVRRQCVKCRLPKPIAGGKMSRVLKGTRFTCKGCVEEGK